MGAYTIDITIYVDIEFPSPEFSAANRTGAIAFGDAVAALVSPTFFAAEKDQAIRDLIAVSAYKDMPEDHPTYTKVLDLAEFSLNLAIDANSGGGIPPSQKYQATFNQVAAAAPVANNTFVDQLGLVSTLRGSAGRFNLIFPANTFTSPTKVKVTVGGLASGVVGTYETDIVDDATISVNTRKAISNVASGVISTSYADDLLVSTLITIEVFQ